MPVDVLDEGRMPYAAAWELQKRLVEERSEGVIGDTLVLVEHDHVITLGKKTTPENFKPQHIPVFQVERGGDATYHGPGQLVGYPIVRLPSPNVHAFVRGLEDALIEATRQFGVNSERVEGHTGVWVDGRKLASIGVAVSNWVTYHGFALNVNTDLAYFRLIRPCGLDPEMMTSMEKLLGTDLDFGAVKREVASQFLKRFDVALAAPAARKD